MKRNKKPCHVIQVYKNAYTYDKKYKDYNSRSQFVAWKNEIHSDTSIEDKILVNKNAYENRTGVSGNLAILVDNNLSTFEDYLSIKKINDKPPSIEELDKLNYQNQEKERKSILLRTLTHRLQDFEIFQLRIQDKIELFTYWDYWKIGNPKRENYKIAELKKDKPISVKIDGKWDFSSTGRRKRTFIEHSYIMEYKGIFDDLIALKEDKKFVKKIPKNVKEINLMKYLK